MHSSSQPRRRIELGLHDQKVIDAAQKHLDALHTLLGDHSAPTLSASHGGDREKIVRDVLKLRRLRQDFFNGGLFSDPAWDILLELYATALSGRRIAVMALADVISAPLSTVIRWVKKLELDGWVRRAHDPFDGRRVWVYLSDKSQQQLDAYFEAWSPLPG